MITHHLVLHCDQNPIPNKCEQRIILLTQHENEEFLIKHALIKRDWGVVEIDGQKKHYCPVHRPVP